MKLQHEAESGTHESINEPYKIRAVFQDGSEQIPGGLQTNVAGGTLSVTITDGGPAMMHVDPAAGDILTWLKSLLAAVSSGG